MTARQVFSVGCRILAVYVLINAAFAIPSLMAWLSYDGSPGYVAVVSSVILLVIAVVLARMLWYRSDWIVSKLFGGDEIIPEAEENDDLASEADHEPQPVYSEDLPITLSTLQPVLLSLLGVYLFATALPSVASTLMAVIAGMNDPSEDRWTGVFFGVNRYINMSTLLPLAVRVGVGVYLAIGANGVSGWLSRVRESRIPA
jgi:hypothetical protein